jgi:hypothetical protein
MHMPDFSLHWDGDLWIVEMDGKLLDGYTSIGEACEAIEEAYREKVLG